ncbi:MULTISPECIES: hypothetical protein [unclassified Amycolatopsis]|uniref:hypothetical protein n=1 Tax=unclassified Amycolatopsis TaxID=2618356 RepID=UPI001C69B672|nr:hypothetical protein [Amycolatopsis sp. DSM 110486]QYN18509.1 hypothetical protein K1T34_38060 [Amycolatopsis sp. DSM 110486]
MNVEREPELFRALCRSEASAVVTAMVVAHGSPAGLELHALGGAYDRVPRVPDAVPGRGAAFRLTTYR